MNAAFADLPDEVSEVERVADEGHPTEEVGETQQRQRAWHVDQRAQVGHGRHRPLVIGRGRLQRANRNVAR